MYDKHEYTSKEVFYNTLNDIKDVELHLAKPNKEIICDLHEAHTIEVIEKLNAPTQLKFKLPYLNRERFELRGETIDDNYVPHVELLRPYYLLRLKRNDRTEWFTLDQKFEDSASSNGESKSIDAFSLEHELIDKLITNYSITNATPFQILKGKRGGARGILTDTGWEVGHIDELLVNTQRDLKIDRKTVLDVIISEIVNLYDANIICDTESRTISIYKNFAEKKDLFFNYGKYLKSLNVTTDVTAMKTRLFVEGKGHQSIESIIPNGKNYIEDFTYFLYPFKLDQYGAVETSSYWMSDDLCKAEIAYMEKLNSGFHDYISLVKKRNSLQRALLVHESRRDQVKNEYRIALDRLTNEQTEFEQTEETTLTKNRKKKVYENAEKVVDNLRADLDEAERDLKDYIWEYDIKNPKNFSPVLLAERTLFTKEAEFKDERYIEPRELYKAAKEYFKKIKEPQTVIKLDIENFLALLEGRADVDKLGIGHEIFIRYDIFNLLVTAKVIEIHYHYRNPKSQELPISITIANVDKVKDEHQKFVDILMDSMDTADTIQKNRTYWDEAVARVEKLEQEMSKAIWNATQKNIVAGTYDTVVMDQKGLTTHNRDEHDYLLRMTGGVLGSSKKGEDELIPLLTAQGINADKLYSHSTGESITIQELKDKTDKLPQLPIKMERDGQNRVCKIYYGHADDPQKWSEEFVRSGTGKVGKIITTIPNEKYAMEILKDEFTKVVLIEKT